VEPAEGVGLHRSGLAVSMQLKNHEWTLMNTNLRTRTMIRPFAPQSLNDGREFRRKGTRILWFHWCLFVFIRGLKLHRSGLESSTTACKQGFSLSSSAGEGWGEEARAHPPEISLSMLSWSFCAVGAKPALRSYFAPPLTSGV
jgi:hypothetical protein